MIKVPKDGWTEEQLKAMRNKMVKAMGKAQIIFSCDDCDVAFRCIYVYDSYNTNGDCLAMK